MAQDAAPTTDSVTTFAPSDVPPFLTVTTAADVPTSPHAAPLTSNSLQPAADGTPSAPATSPGGCPEESCGRFGHCHITLRVDASAHDGAASLRRQCWCLPGRTGANCNRFEMPACVSDAGQPLDGGAEHYHHPSVKGATGHGLAGWSPLVCAGGAFYTKLRSCTCFAQCAAQLVAHGLPRFLDGPRFDVIPCYQEMQSTTTTTTATANNNSSSSSSSSSSRASLEYFRGITGVPIEGNMGRMDGRKMITGAR